MADLKISQLTAASTPLAGTEVLPIVQSSTTRKVSVADLTVGRSVAAASILSSGAVTANSASADSNVALTVKETASLSAAISMWNRNSTQQWKLAVDAAAVDDKLLAIIDGSLNKVIATFDPATTNVNVSLGNLAFSAAAKGVNFTANTPAAGMTSQLLNAYEEGTWTPALKFDSGMSGSFTYTTQIGTYTRVGRLITARFNLAWSAIPSAGTVMVMDLPFTALTAANVQGFISNQGGITNTGTYAITGGDGLVVDSYITTQCAISTVKSGAAYADPLQKSALTSASGQLKGVITYEVA